MAVSEENLALAPVVVAAREGDAEAFGALAERFRRPMHAYAEALLRDEGHAEDAVQMALLHAWKRVRDLRDPGAFRTWLYSVLENEILTGLRYRRRRRAFQLRPSEAVAEGDPMLEIVEEPILPGEEIPVAPVVDTVRRSMAAIPETYRQALLLHYVEGRSTRDLGHHLGLPYNTARVRVFRARGALRRELARRGVTGLPEDAEDPREEAS